MCSRAVGNQPLLGVLPIGVLILDQVATISLAREG